MRRTFPEHYEDGHTAGLRLLRVAARARQNTAATRSAPLYEALGARMFDTPRDGPLSASDQGSRHILEPLLRDAGLPVDLADALDDTTFDDEIRAETEEALDPDRPRRRHADPALSAARTARRSSAR